MILVSLLLCHYAAYRLVVEEKVLSCDGLHDCGCWVVSLLASLD